MTGAYRRLYSVPGAAAFSLAGLVGRLSLGMNRFAIVAMLSQRPGAFALAGTVTATQAVSSAVVGPRIARAADRHGQRKVLIPTAAAGTAAMAALVVSYRLDAPAWTYYAAALAAGVIPNVGSMVRARWAEIFHGRGDLHSAYSLESVIDEVVFTVGPVIAIGLSTSVAPEAGLIASAAALATGCALLASQTRTEPVVKPLEPGRGKPAIANAGMPALVTAFLAIGAIFASIEVITMAVASGQGHKALASPVLAVYALGSALAGLVYGSSHPPGTPRTRLLAGTVLMTLTMLPLLAAHSLPAIGVVLFVAGAACAPTVATAMQVVELTVPRGQVTEGITWAGTGLGFGIALGASVAGAVANHNGGQGAFIVPVAGGIVAIAAVSSMLATVSRHSDDDGNSTSALAETTSGIPGQLRHETSDRLVDQ